MRVRSFASCIMISLRNLFSCGVNDSSSEIAVQGKSLSSNTCANLLFKLNCFLVLKPCTFASGVGNFFLKLYWSCSIVGFSTEFSVLLFVLSAFSAFSTRLGVVGFCVVEWPFRNSCFAFSRFSFLVSLGFFPILFLFFLVYIHHSF